ncbi:MAG TPA: PEP-CTERM sorting domain-containing protein [Usitatibacter sp.]|jgi:hypothetical protein
MRRHYRWVALAATTLAAAAFGQQQAASAASTANPLSRNGDLFSPSFRSAFGPDPLAGGANAIGRPGTIPLQPVTPVTPVPEPSEWLMMVSGLGMVGWILRRRSRRS